MTREKQPQFPKNTTANISLSGADGDTPDTRNATTPTSRISAVGRKAGGERKYLEEKSEIPAQPSGGCRPAGE